MNNISIFHFCVVNVNTLYTVVNVVKYCGGSTYLKIILNILKIATRRTSIARLILNSVRLTHNTRQVATAPS